MGAQDLGSSVRSVSLCDLKAEQLSFFLEGAAGQSPRSPLVQTLCYLRWVLLLSILPFSSGPGATLLSNRFYKNDSFLHYDWFFTSNSLFQWFLYFILIVLLVSSLPFGSLFLRPVLSLCSKNVLPLQAFIFPLSSVFDLFLCNITLNTFRHFINISWLIGLIRFPMFQTSHLSLLTLDSGSSPVFLELEYKSFFTYSNLSTGSSKWHPCNC